MSGSFWYRGEPGGHARLAHLLATSTYFRIVVPSRTPSGRLLPLDQWAATVLQAVLPLSGGATEITATGHWLNQRGRVVTESVRLLDVYVLRRLGALTARRFVDQLAGFAWQMRQEALAVAVGHQLHFIRTPARARDSVSRRNFLQRAASQARLGGNGRGAA